MQTAPDLIDATDHCRRCNGKGGHRDQTERGTWITETCWLCRGTGLRTIHVGEVQS